MILFIYEDVGVKKTSTPSPHTVPVLRKAMRILQAVAESPGESSVKSLSSSLDVSESTCYRILQTFVAGGWLRPLSGGRFAPSFGLLPLFKHFHPEEVLARAAEAPLRDLSAATGLSAKLVVRQGREALTLHSVTPNRPMAVVPQTGACITLAIGSSGAALLSLDDDAAITAFIASQPPDTWRHQGPEQLWSRVTEARDRGFCRDSGSYDPHLHTLSLRVPIAAPMPVTVLTLLGFPGDFSAKKLPILEAALATAAESLAANVHQAHETP